MPDKCKLCKKELVENTDNIIGSKNKIYCIDCWNKDGFEDKRKVDL